MGATTGKLCFLCCQNFRPEIEAAIAAEGWPDVGVAAFPVRCGHPPLHWDELHPLLTNDCTQVVVLGRACLQELHTPPKEWPSVQCLKQEECFDLVAGPTLVAETIARDGYLVTPGWLEDWRGNLRHMGFDEGSAAEFFQDFAGELVLLDTGTFPDASRKLAELSRTVGLPVTRIAVGIDYVRLYLARTVAEWRLGAAQKQAQECEQKHVRELADHVSAMDFLGRLALLKDERETAAAIEEMFRMLFAPQEFFYVRFEHGVSGMGETIPPEVSAQIRSLDRDWAWTESGTGFLLRISVAGETLAVVLADQFAFPEFRDRYLNLALSVAGVCGLAVENARTYRRIRDTEEALRRSEYSLRMAQALAHLGHWEWDMQAGEMKWSDETYRILGYEPKALEPSHDAFIQVIHPDDRKKVADYIAEAARARDGFELEYRIILPDGKVRIVHGLGETIVGADDQPKMLGTIVDVTMNEPMEILGVIQDITDRKELETRLAQEAQTDALTGCANRRYFLKQAALELTRVRRYGGGLSVFMLDLDHFKQVNDRYGHRVGDMVLQKLVQVCRATLREEDMIGRLGGEEFAVLLPETGREKAVEVAQRLCVAVATAEVFVDHLSLHFTTSIGMATLAPDDGNIDALLDRADRALYEAKNTGRNRVVTA